MDLIKCIHHARSHMYLRHMIYSYHSCHWDLPLQGLRVSHTIPYHDGKILATIVHIGVGVLYCQTLGNDPSSAHRA